MNKFRFVSFVLPWLGGLVCGGAAAQSQAQQPEPESYTYATYLNCDFTQQDRVDELVKKHLAPLYDKMVADGKLVSWSWMEHIVGGEYRRLEVLTGRDIPTLMAARTSLVDAMQDNPASTLLDEICTSHTDYIWEIKLSK